MPLSEQIQSLMVEVNGYEPERQSFFLGRIAALDEIGLEELLAALSQFSEEVSVSYRYGQFEKDKERGLMEIADRSADEDEMQKFIEMATQELAEMGLSAGLSTAVNILTFFTEHMQLMMEDILVDKEAGNYPKRK